MTEISYGKKYEAGLTVIDIAKRVREEIKAAVKAGELPEGLKVAIRTSRGGGRSINPTIMAVPDGFTLHNSEWVEADAAGENTHRSNLDRYTPEAVVVAKKIEAMIAAYNYDGSDSMTDYFNVNFYGGYVSWDRKVEKADLARVLANLKGEPAPDETPLEFGPEAVIKTLTEATHWTNWSASEVARDLHVGLDKARKVLEAMAAEGKLFAAWNRLRQAIVYRLPKKGDDPENAREHREYATKKAAEVKEAKAAKKAERKKARAEYEERQARENEELKARVTRKVEGEVEEEEDGLAGRVRAKAAQLALEADDKVKDKKVSLSGPTFVNTTIGWC